MLRTFSAWALTAALSILPGNSADSADSADPALLYSAPQPKADGYRGIWYFNQPSDDQYKYKYSGGFATYPQLTPNSERNHTYARRPVNAHPDFYAIWADGDAWQPSESNLYFTDRAGSRVWRLPGKMTADLESPEVAW